MSKVRPLKAVIERLPHVGGLEAAVVTQLRPMNLLETWWHSLCTAIVCKSTERVFTDEELHTLEYTVGISPALCSMLSDGKKGTQVPGYQINIVLTPIDSLKLSASKAEFAGGTLV